MQPATRVGSGPWWSPAAVSWGSPSMSPTAARVSMPTASLRRPALRGCRRRSAAGRRGPEPPGSRGGGGQWTAGSVDVRVRRPAAGWRLGHSPGDIGQELFQSKQEAEARSHRGVRAGQEPAGEEARLGGDLNHPHPRLNPQGGRLGRCVGAGRRCWAGPGAPGLRRTARTYRNPLSEERRHAPAPRETRRTAGGESGRRRSASGLRPSPGSPSQLRGRKPPG